MLARFLFLRIRKAILPDFERRWRRDIAAALDDTRRQYAALQAELAELREFKRHVSLRDWAAATEPLLERVRDISLDAVRAHVTDAIERATLAPEPTAHIVVERVLPDAVYDLLAAAIPPKDLFPDRDPVKRDFEMSALPTAPPLTRSMWGLFDEAIVSGIVAPLLFERFRPAIVGHYATTGGETFGLQAAGIPHRTFAGRIQLRTPGYRLKPHLDPKRVVITGLFYFPRAGDTEDYGTQLFSVDRPVVSDTMATFFPEDAGAVCALAKTVPYRPNTMLAFVNSGAAHGAHLPSDAALDERYAYQFYVKPVDGHLKKLLRDLPADARAAWEEIL